MKTLAILPVKSFGAAKQRLAESLGAGARQALAQAMFIDVLACARRVPGLHAIAVVTPDRAAESVAADSRTGILVLREDVQNGHSAAAMLGIRRALADEYERVLLIPGDTPLLQPAELATLLAGEPGAERGDRITTSRDVVIVPDRHGSGTNALLMAPPDAIEPSFGPGSLARHVAAAEAAGLPHRVEEISGLALDVDTPDDLAELTAQLELSHGAAPATRGALRQLDRAGAQPMRLPHLSR